MSEEDKQSLPGNVGEFMLFLIITGKSIMVVPVYGNAVFSPYIRKCTSCFQFHF